MWLTLYSYTTIVYRTRFWESQTPGRWLSVPVPLLGLDAGVCLQNSPKKMGNHSLKFLSWAFSCGGYFVANAFVNRNIRGSRSNYAQTGSSAYPAVVWARTAGEQSEKKGTVEDINDVVARLKGGFIKKLKKLKSKPCLKLLRQRTQLSPKLKPLCWWQRLNLLKIC